jgi:predicted dienelactone hydrolase
METLASHGFVVISPSHTGNSVNDCIGTGVPDPFAEAAVKRPGDVSFLIDSMIARSFDPTDFFFARVHPYRIGVAGHSFSIHGARDGVGRRAARPRHRGRARSARARDRGDGARQQHHR